MSPRRRLLVALAAALAGGCAAFAPSTWSFSQSEIQARMMRRFPWKRTVLGGLVELELTNPAVRLDAERNRIATAFDAALRLRGSSRAYTGRAALSGLPRYDAGQRAFFLAEAMVDTLEIDGLSRSLADDLRSLARVLAPELFDAQPIYTLRPEDARLFGTEMTATGIRVVGDRVVVDLAPR